MYYRYFRNGPSPKPYLALIRALSLSLSALCTPRCMNGGLCVTPGFCICPPGFYGVNCDKGNGFFLRTRFFLLYKCLVKRSIFDIPSLSIIALLLGCKTAIITLTPNFGVVQHTRSLLVLTECSSAGIPTVSGAALHAMIRGS